MDSGLLNEVIKNQKKMLKEVKKIDGKCSQIKLCQDSLLKKIMGKEFDGLEEMKKVSVFFDKAIKKYNMKDLSISNLNKNCKKKIKNEMKYDEISKCTQELKGNIKIIEEFFTALTPDEEPENYDLQKELENYLDGL